MGELLKSYVMECVFMKICVTQRPKTTLNYISYGKSFSIYLNRDLFMFSSPFSGRLCFLPRNLSAFPHQDPEFGDDLPAGVLGPLSQQAGSHIRYTVKQIKWGKFSCISGNMGGIVCKVIYKEQFPNKWWKIYPFAPNYLNFSSFYQSILQSLTQ